MGHSKKYPEKYRRPQPGHSKISPENSGGHKWVTPKISRKIQEATTGSLQKYPEKYRRPQPGHSKNIPKNTGGHNQVTSKISRKIQEATTGSLRNIPRKTQEATTRSLQKISPENSGGQNWVTPKISRKIQEATTGSLQKYPEKYRRPQPGHSNKSEKHQKYPTQNPRNIFRNMKIKIPQLRLPKYIPKTKEASPPRHTN